MFDPPRPVEIQRRAVNRVTTVIIAYRSVTSDPSNRSRHLTLGARGKVF